MAFSIPVAMLVLGGCSANQAPAPPGKAVVQDSDAPGPAYFTQITESGARYSHNWVSRPCFSLELPGHQWVLQAATADYVLWRDNERVLKVYLADNRSTEFAVSGMTPEDTLRAFIGYELDYIKPRFTLHRSPAPLVNADRNGVWAHWLWEGREGRRAGVGTSTPADQKHRLATLWLDPWALSFDWATPDVEAPDGETADMAAVLDSLVFHPKCFTSMRTGETWGHTAADAARATAPPGGEVERKPEPHGPLRR